MDLPKLTPGNRFTLPRPAGSADALLLARLALREKAASRLTAIVTADANDAQRLLDELALHRDQLEAMVTQRTRQLERSNASLAEQQGLLWRDLTHMAPTEKGYDFLNDLQAMFLPGGRAAS